MEENSKSTTTNAMNNSVHWQIKGDRLIVSGGDYREEYWIDDPDKFWVLLRQYLNKHKNWGPAFGHPYLEQWAGERGIGIKCLSVKQVKADPPD